MVIAFFVVLLVIMPKNNKEERKAAHLLIDKYGIQVAKKNNPVRQMALLEVALGISTYRGSRKKTFIFNCRNNNNVCNSDSPSIFITYRCMG